jgi:type VI secretion system secreted protein VgrG
MPPDATTLHLKVGDALLAQVHAAHVEEGVSRPFRAEVHLAAEALDVESLRGAPASLSVTLPSGGARHLHGVVDEVAVALAPATQPSARVAHRVVIVPAPWWSLAYRHGFRIFQDLDAVAIVRTLLREGGVDDAQVSVDVARTPPVRPYCVQYDESDWAFAERLLEDEGIHYAFTHDADRWTLVLRDRSPDATAATPASLGFVPDAPAEALDEVAWSGALTTRVAEAAARVDGYDPTRPSLVLGADARAEGQAGRRCYEWPAPHREPRESQQTARVRLDALRAERETLTVETHAVTVTPGTRLQVLDHPWSTHEGWFVVSSRWSVVIDDTARASVLREAAARGIRCALTAVPESTPWRPARRAPRPRVLGVQTARVTGPAGQEIYCDALGRVKVQFHWDLEGALDERTSCWIRVTQGHTTGSVMIPRIGWEVLVEFADGDPDRPVCLGKLWNPMHPPHITLPGGRTQSSFSTVSSPGGAGVNSVVFEDQAGLEEIAVTGSHDLVANTANNKVVIVGQASTTTVTGDRTVDIGGDDTAAVLQNLRVRGGADESLTVGGNRVRNSSGSVTEEIGGALSLTVGAMEMIKVGSVAAAVLQVVRDEVVEAAAGAVAERASRAAAALVGPLQPALSRAGALVGPASRLAGPAAALLTGGNPDAAMFGDAVNALTENPGTLDGAAAASSLAQSLAQQALAPAPPATGGGGGDAGGAAAATAGGSGTWSTVVGGDVTESIGGAQVLNALAGLSVNIGGSSELRVGAASLTLAGGISETTGGSKAEQVGALVVQASESAALTAGAALAMNVAGAERRTVSGAHAVAAQGPLVVNAPTLQIKAGGSITLSCGGSKVVINSGGVSIEGAASVTLKGGTIVLDESVLGT